MKKNVAEGLLKISEVAKAADISVSTVKYYVKEGLVQIACKTGKNMAYYSPESVDRVKQIKSLQSEKYYPLSVIKRIVESGADSAEAQLLDTINKADELDYYETLPLSQAAKESGLKPRELVALISAGLIVPHKSGRSKLCCHGDLRLMKLVKCRMEAGIPLEQTISSFSMYESYLKEATRKDIESLVADGMLKKPLTTEDVDRIINISDETLDSFIGMKRYALNAEMGREYISKTEQMLSSLSVFADGMEQLLIRQEKTAQSKLFSKARSGEKCGDVVVDAFCSLLNLEGAGIAYSLSAIHSAGLAMEKRTSSVNSDDEKFSSALRLGFIFFALPEFGYNRDSEVHFFEEITVGGEFAQSVLKLLRQH